MKHKSDSIVSGSDVQQFAYRLNSLTIYFQSAVCVTGNGLQFFRITVPILLVKKYKSSSGEN